jgi:hypothetical protein
MTGVPTTSPPPQFPGVHAVHIPQQSGQKWSVPLDAPFYHSPEGFLIVIKNNTGKAGNAF